MATYYWVPSGGSSTGPWNSTSTTNWASSSGGAGGAGFPTSTDDIVFDANSSVGTTAFTVNANQIPSICRNCTISGLTAVMSLSSLGLQIYGSLSLPSTNFNFSVSSATVFAGTGTHTITSSGNSVGSTVQFSGIGGTYTLTDNFTTTGALSQTQALTLTASANVTCSTYTCTTAGAVLNMGTGTWTTTGTGSVWSVSSMTLNPQTSTLSIAGSSTKTFSGGGYNYYNLNLGGTVSGVTFNSAFSVAGTFSKTSTNAMNLQFVSTTTYYINNWTVTGTSGNVVTVTASGAGSAFNLVKTGTAYVSSVNFMSFRDCNATPSTGCWFVGANSTSVSGNTGLTFTAAATPVYLNTGNVTIGLGVTIGGNYYTTNLLYQYVNGTSGYGNVTAPFGTTSVSTEAIGAGGAGSVSIPTPANRAGGGGAAYAGSFNIPCTAGTVVYYYVAPASANASWVNIGSNTTPVLSSTGCLAAGGSNASAGVAGAGGTTAASIGAVTRAGGSGFTQGGGGGAAGFSTVGSSATGLSGGAGGTDLEPAPLGTTYTMAGGTGGAFDGIGGTAPGGASGGSSSLGTPGGIGAIRISFNA